MDGILALGHFCESHGPCVILCTQRCKEEPQQFPHSLTVPWCESCQSVDLEQALISRNGNTCYVTTRTPLHQDLAFLLKQATVRSLSCEEDTSKDGGALYFGDNERGHVLSHMFTLQDSLARGFHRKYTILILMKDKVHLLNSWPMLTRHIKEIASDLKKKAANINGAEQAQKSQRAVRQAQSSPTNPSRSLSQLTGEPAIFAHLHMWFVWLLSSETVTEKPFIVPSLPADCKPECLKKLAREMDESTFRTIAYCVLTAIRVDVDPEVLNAFRQLLPSHFVLPTTGDICRVTFNEGKWSVLWSGQLPPKLPTLLVMAEKALKDDNLPNEALEPHLNSLILQWYNTACSLKWTPSQNPQLLHALGIHKHDLPLLAYWTTQCKDTI